MLYIFIELSSVQFASFLSVPLGSRRVCNSPLHPVLPFNSIKNGTSFKKLCCDCSKIGRIFTCNNIIYFCVRCVIVVVLLKEHKIVFPVDIECEGDEHGKSMLKAMRAPCTNGRSSLTHAHIHEKSLLRCYF